MNRLTDRLQLIAEQIQTGETMADIGTDHGFLPIYLWRNGISPKVIMCDISEPSLDKAIKAAQEFHSSDKLLFRAGDGLKVLDNGEVDAVVIAGMGGNLICDILAANITKAKSFKRFIFQPRNNCGNLRYWLEHNGFYVYRNLLVREGKFICEIICAIPTRDDAEVNGNCHRSNFEKNHAYWDFPRDIIKSQGDLAIEYARTKLSIEEKILEGLMLSTEEKLSEIDQVKNRIEYFKSLLA